MTEWVDKGALQECLERARWLWREYRKRTQLHNYGLMEKGKVKEVIREMETNLRRVDPLWRLVRPYDLVVNHDTLYIVVTRALANLPSLEKVTQFNRRRFQQFCGFGACWREKKNYNPRMKRALMAYLVYVTFPLHLPARSFWGEQVREEYKRLRQKRRKASPFQLGRLALLHVGRCLVKELYALCRQAAAAQGEPSTNPSCVDV